MSLVSEGTITSMTLVSVTSYKLSHMLPLTMRRHSINYYILVTLSDLIPLTLDVHASAFESQPRSLSLVT